ncbi:hypothetical protein [Pimelobacter simplex]|uniref:hypothetical protein n=1 Tax=Nocardioides simplex TaxID=2045 RepID=UPI00214FF1AD|nr:hypothetical protein [Pimelobacter simplex]UUW88438.1 hypothetical protein M0M43_22225 [Pimelobacter simplex]UUW97942.1 hypothetical protein M0M48_10870 [Pimelobacter simplex]
MKYTVRPLSDRTWLRPNSQRTGTRFTAKWKETEQLLLDEVAHLDGRQLVIEVDVREQDLRLDGTLRTNAREASSPGVVVAFESKHGPMLYRCDTFVAPYTWQGVDWQHNVRAVALTLQSLRAVDRYGATDTGQQYQGFKAIGGGTAMPAAATMGRAEALRVVYDLTGFRLEGDPQSEAVQKAWRSARASVHPDRHGGDHQRWNLVEQAARALGVAR